MKITLSKSQWEKLGNKEGLMNKEANDLGLYEFDTPKSKIVNPTAKKEFDAILETLKFSLDNWRAKYVHYGARDTAATDAQIKHIRRFIQNVIIGL